MLILSRRIGEKIMIGDDIVIQLVSIQGRQARIGITAPEDVVVDREEIHDRKIQEKEHGKA